MADAPVVHIEENSPEQVAFKLVKAIFGCKGKNLDGFDNGISQKLILDTYAECLRTVRDPEGRILGNHASPPK